MVSNFFGADLQGVNGPIHGVLLEVIRVGQAGPNQTILEQLSMMAKPVSDGCPMSMRQELVPRSLAA